MLIPSLTTQPLEFPSIFKGPIEKAIKLLKEEKHVKISSSGSEGGYFSHWEANYLFGNPKLIDIVVCGSFPLAKMPFYFSYSIEKAYRLNSHLHEGHKTSRQSANKDNEEYAGAILSGQKLYSFSGIISEGDEFLSALGNAIDAFRLHSREMHDVVREHSHAIYKKSSKLITANDDLRKAMDEVAYQVIEEEIATLGKK